MSIKGFWNSHVAPHRTAGTTHSWWQITLIDGFGWWDPNPEKSCETRNYEWGGKRKEGWIMAERTPPKKAVKTCRLAQLSRRPHVWLRSIMSAGVTWLWWWCRPPGGGGWGCRHLLGDIIDICVLWKNTTLFLSGNTEPLQTHLQSELRIQRGKQQAESLGFGMWAMPLAMRCLQYLLLSCLFPLQRGALLQQNFKKKEKEKRTRSLKGSLCSLLNVQNKPKTSSALPFISATTPWTAVLLSTFTASHLSSD